MSSEKEWREKCEVILSQTTKIQMPQKSTDFPPMLKLNGKKVIC